MKRARALTIESEHPVRVVEETEYERRKKLTSRNSIRKEWEHDQAFSTELQVRDWARPGFFDVDARGNSMALSLVFDFSWANILPFQSSNLTYQTYQDRQKLSEL